MILLSYVLSALSPAAAVTPQPVGPPRPAPSLSPVIPAPPAAKGGSGPSMRTAHRWLGYAAVGAGAVAAFSSHNDNLHCAAAWTAAGLGTAALATGIIKYRRTFDLSNGISRFDGHAILGGIAAAGFITACLLAGSWEDDEGEDDDDVNLAHAGVGGAALGVMALSVVVVKFKW